MPQLPRGGQVPLHVHRGLGVESEHAGARVGELAEVALGMLHHEVDVDGQVGEPAQRADQRRAERQIGHEVPVHHVHVQPLGAAFDGTLDLLPQAGPGRRSARCGRSARSWPASRPRLTTSSTWSAARPALAGGRPGCQHDAALLSAATVSTLPTRTPAAAMIYSRSRQR